MNIAEYWYEKADILKSAFESWPREEEIQVRKLVIAKMMDIPRERIAFHLKRNDWYLKFVHGDDSELDCSFIMDERTEDKVQEIIQEYFYRKDYEALCRIKISDVSKDASIFSRRKDSVVTAEYIGKENVCERITKLVENKIYTGLNKSDKMLLDTLEKIYFEPIELFNEDMEEKTGSETYYSLLLEQWKTANEMAANISDQRNNMNNFYMSLMSILVGGVLFSDQILGANILLRSALYSAILIVGTVCCNKWIAQIDNYGKLNGAKYNVINAIERKLPANVMLYEYIHTEQVARKSNVKINFSKQEKDIAKLFRVIVISVPVFMLLTSWGEYLFTIIHK